MSWIEKVKNGMRITTGDGEQYTPDWMNASFQTEYNYTEFTFIDVVGSFVKKKKPMGVKYALELYFQGDDHIELAAKFKKSCDNESPWIIEHPLYDLLTVQITSLNFDNTQLNVTKITGTVIETLEEAPISNLFRSAVDDIEILNFQTAEFAEASLTETPTPADINTMSQNNTTAFRKGVPIITEAVDYSDYNNAFNTAATYINTATATPLLAMRSLIAVIQMPGKFTASVQQRINVLVDTFNSLRANLFGLINVSAKQIFTAEQCANISAMCAAAATPLTTDYKNKTSVLEMLNIISGRYSQLVTDLDELQSANGGSPLSFVPNAELLIALNQLVNITVSNLFDIAMKAKSERSIILGKDTNIIVLTHRLYGLDANDQNIEELMAINDIGLDELLQIEKGRKIVYYI